MNTMTETAPLATSCEQPWLGTSLQRSCYAAHFSLSPEGLQWHPTQLASWSRRDLFLLVEVLNQYAQHRGF